MARVDEEGLRVLIHDHLHAGSSVEYRNLNSGMDRGYRTTVVGEDVVSLVVVHGLEASTEDDIRGRECIGVWEHQVIPLRIERDNGGRDRGHSGKGS